MNLAPPDLLPIGYLTADLGEPLTIRETPMARAG